ARRSSKKSCANTPAWALDGDYHGHGRIAHNPRKRWIMKKKTAKEFVEESLPDLEVVEVPGVPTPDAVRRATRPGPTLAELRKKYLALDAEEDLGADAMPAATTGEEEVVVKQVRSKQTPADPAD